MRRTFGSALPELGVRVVYTAELDAKTGRPRAAEVMPEEMYYGMEDRGQSTGTIKHNSGKSGFILQDSGESDMFVMPKQCEAFGYVIPPVGTPVVYSISVDLAKGKPLAENVQPLEG